MKSDQRGQKAQKELKDQNSHFFWLTRKDQKNLTYLKYDTCHIKKIINLNIERPVRSWRLNL